MLRMNEGWFSSSTTNGASSNTKRRNERRAVSSSGRIAKPGPLERGQSVAELHPADVVAQPGMMGRREGPRRIETARRDVDEIGGVDMFVGERRTTFAAEAAQHLG